MATLVARVIPLRNIPYSVLSGIDDYGCPCTSARSAGERRVVAVAIGAINRSTASAVRAASLCDPRTHRVRTGTLADSVGSNGYRLILSDASVSFTNRKGGRSAYP
ncbi:uncharacterized protein METZ01_LOCUS176063 [marine metagenome]|uniref:Uncharacterized protein n=1 Tax=marine metagenome TaxID=408172 RepID=A0A382CBI5_9ZZZZ